jgi:hypothetical protein
VRMMQWVSCRPATLRRWSASTPRTSSLTQRTSCTHASATQDFDDVRRKLSGSGFQVGRRAVPLRPCLLLRCDLLSHNCCQITLSCVTHTRLDTHALFLPKHTHTHTQLPHSRRSCLTSTAATPWRSSRCWTRWLGGAAASSSTSTAAALACTSSQT